MKIGLTIELDARTLSKPELPGLLSAIAALDGQAPATFPAPYTRHPSQIAPANGHNAKPANSGGNGQGQGVPRPATDKQRSALKAIARQADVDLYASCRQTFGVDFDQLQAWQASKLIDSLKASAAN